MLRELSFGCSLTFLVPVRLTRPMTSGMPNQRLELYTEYVVTLETTLESHFYYRRPTSHYSIFSSSLICCFRLLSLHCIHVVHPPRVMAVNGSVTARYIRHAFSGINANEKMLALKRAATKVAGRKSVVRIAMVFMAALSRLDSWAMLALADAILMLVVLSRFCMRL